MQAREQIAVGVPSTTGWLANKAIISALNPWQHKFHIHRLQASSSSIIKNSRTEGKGAKKHSQSIEFMQRDWNGIVTLIHINAKHAEDLSMEGERRQAIKFEILLCCRMQTVPIFKRYLCAKLRKLDGIEFLLWSPTNKGQSGDHNCRRSEMMRW